MQELVERKSARSNAPCSIVGYPSQWTSNDSTLSNNLSLKMVSSNPHHQITKQLGFQFQDQDSSSTQSTCQSFPEVASAGDSYGYGDKKFSIQSAYNGTHGAHEEGSIGSALSTGAQDYVFASQADCRQPYGCIPLVYPDPYYRGLVAPFGSQNMIHHPQTLSVTSTRVALPLDFPHDEPIYVNAKQYNAILRRRQHRAKLEAQNKLSRPRKPYLHESRHVHALKRARGPGGRFLNKKTDEGKPEDLINGLEAPSHLEGGGGGSNGGNAFFRPQERRFTVYHSCMGGPPYDGGSDNGGTHNHFR